MMIGLALMRVTNITIAWQPLYVIFHAVERFSNTLKQCLSKQLYSSKTPSNEMNMAKVRKKLIQKQSI